MQHVAMAWRNFTSQLISKHNNAQIDVHIKCCCIHERINCERQRKSPIDEKHVVHVR